MPRKIGAAALAAASVHAVVPHRRALFFSSFAVRASLQATKYSQFKTKQLAEIIMRPFAVGRGRPLAAFLNYICFLPSPACRS